MKKIPYENFTSTLTSFFVYPNIDEKAIAMQKNQVEILQAQMADIGSYTGPISYIRKYNDSLDNLLALLGVSQEFFKRIISLFRIERGYTFSTEWSLSATRKKLLDDDAMMKRVCDLFLSGQNDASLASKIPPFKLAGFLITKEVVDRLNNSDFMNLLVRGSIETQFNADISAENVSQIEKILLPIAEHYDYIISRSVNVDPIGNGTRDILTNYILTENEKELPSIYIKYSFNLTTSNAQTSFKKSVKDLRSYIRTQNPDAKLITIVDGAGWIARQSDLHDIWDYSDFCINLNSINQLELIIKSLNI